VNREHRFVTATEVACWGVAAACCSSVHSCLDYHFNIY